MQPTGEAQAITLEELLEQVKTIVEQFPDNHEAREDLETYKGLRTAPGRKFALLAWLIRWSFERSSK